MADHDKVLKGLECCTADDERFDLCKACPYRAMPGAKSNCLQLEKDALELLKEQDEIIRRANHAT